MKYLRWLLLPFSLLYGLVVIIRNWCYDAGFFKSYRFSKPVITVGNLDVGGAGKSPMTEYLVRLLQHDYRLATLSRGYGRKTKGYHVAGAETAPFILAGQIGDEPAQFKQKFPAITVAVCEKRVEGLRQLLPNHDIVILDDAYQHRAAEAGLSILLFDYNRLNEPHLLLPAGNLREPFSGRWRAQVMVVTKCPSHLSPDEMEDAVAKLKPQPYQNVFFSTIAYRKLTAWDGKETDVTIDGNTTVFLLTGIASDARLVEHLGSRTQHIIRHNYPDHHRFTLKNIAKLAAEFAACPSDKKIIVTTEKDAQRLDYSWFESCRIPGGKLAVYVQPIVVEFLDDGERQFNQLITDYVREYPAYDSLY